MKVEITYNVIPSKGDMSFEDRVREALAFIEAYKALYDMKEKRYKMYTREAFLGFCEKMEAILNDEVY